MVWLEVSLLPRMERRERGKGGDEPSSAVGIWFTKEACASINWQRYFALGGAAKTYVASKVFPL